MKKKTIAQKEEEIFYVGSGNVYKDFNYPNPEEAKAKADLARQIFRIIKDKKLTQEKAAEIMGIDQPRVSDILKGKLSRYSLDRLMRFLRALGTDIEIRLKTHEKKSSHPTLFVTHSSNARPAV